MRDSHERTGREVAACQARIGELRGCVATLEREVDATRAAHALLDSEMEVRQQLLHRAPSRGMLHFWARMAIVYAELTGNLPGGCE